MVSKVLPENASRRGTVAACERSLKRLRTDRVNWLPAALARPAPARYSPFGHGRFPKPRSAGGRVLQAIAAAHGVTPRQVALRFLVRRPSLFAIPKASTAEHAAENAGAGDLDLSQAEIASIDEAFPLGRRPRALPVL